MRLDGALASALLSSLALFGQVHAEEGTKSEATSSVIEKPTFTVCPKPHCVRTISWSVNYTS
jgi:hypothetical protein